MSGKLIPERLKEIRRTHPRIEGWEREQYLDSPDFNEGYIVTVRDDVVDLLAHIEAIEEELADRRDAEQALMEMLDTEVTDNARLRAALERIAECDGDMTTAETGDACRVAREALEGK